MGTQVNEMSIGHLLERTTISACVGPMAVECEDINSESWVVLTPRNMSMMVENAHLAVFRRAQRQSDPDEYKKSTISIPTTS